jgi:hypothetical protein
VAKPLQKIMRHVGQHGIVRPRYIKAIGLPREYLVPLHRQGAQSAWKRNPRLPDANVTERQFYAEGGDVCAWRNTDNISGEGPQFGQVIA